MNHNAIDIQKFAGPAHIKYQRGTSEMYGSVMDRGTMFTYFEAHRYPKGLRTNAAGTAVLVDPSGGTTPFVLTAGVDLLYRWKAIAATNSAAHGTSSIDNFVVIWD